MKPLRVVLLVLSSLLFIGCSVDLKVYDEVEPKFGLFDYFSGKTRAWGMVQDYRGKQTRRFEVDIVGVVEGERLTLNETFTYDDGETDTRRWVITKLADGRYVGQADDVIGEAYGEEVGNALRWRYDFELSIDGDAIRVHFDDWLYRQDDRHLFNITKIKKFGIEVGKLTIFFQKQYD
jgi:hypothetical protein